MNIKEIAELAKVSTTTVSRVLNNNYKNNMRPETYNRILKVINQFNYKPHALAMGLRKGFVKIIGIIIPDNSNPYFALLCRAIEEKCFLYGYGTFFCNSNLDVERGKYYLEYLNGQKIAGIILCNYGFKKEDVISIIGEKTNMVLLGEKIEGVNFNFIGVDDFRGGYIAAEYLYKLGHRKILILRGPNKFLASFERLKGFLKYMDEKDNKIDSENIITCDSTFTSGYNTISKIIKKGLNFSAIFTFNDFLAVGVIKLLNENGLTNKTSIIGFDNIFISEITSPSLTTISIDIKKLGEKAVTCIIDRINDNKITKIESIFLKPRLIIRESCRKYFE